MIDLHYWTTPNGHKVTMFLEEAGLQYNLIPVNIGKGEQFKTEFLAISPNNRIPALVDHDPPGGGAPISVCHDRSKKGRSRKRLDFFLRNRRYCCSPPMKPEIFQPPASLL